MNAIRVIWVGRSGKDFIQRGVEHYLARIRPLRAIECVAVRPAAHSGRQRQAALQKEGAALLGKVTPREALVVLDEDGRQCTTRELAALLEDLTRRQARQVTFILGGAHGLHPMVRERADAVLSLSRLTFPHQLVRLILLEQLYRVLTLAAGHAYHHD